MNSKTILNYIFPYFGLLLILVLFFGLPSTSFSQSMADIASIKVDELSDDQIKELVSRANEAGLSEEALLQMARQRGVPATEIEKLRNRIQNLALTKESPTRTPTPTSKREPRRQADLNEIAQGILQFRQGFSGLEDSNASIFGTDLFYNINRRLSFEPNLNLATPKNYVVGPGDMLYVDIYGQSEQYYEATVNPDGFVLLDNIGPVSISGKTIEEATGIIRNRLSTYYSGLSGSNPDTFVQVTLGNVRTIKVHLVGEVRLPGTFTLSAFSSVFNALYSAGGPSENGTMRNIQIVRDGEVVSTIDVYEFLVNGKANLSFQLQDQDVILVKPFLSRVTVSGEVKRPNTFEVKEGENFEELLQYAGGFTDEAFQERVNVTRITGKDRTVSDVYKDQFSIFSVKGGDRYTITKVLDRYINRVQIKGAVFREGNYALTPGLTLSSLIKNADGIRGDAYLERASILRTNDDLTSDVLSVNLRKLLNGTQKDIPLQREDVVRISSIYDLKDEMYVQASGEVRNPGTYPYSKQMTVEELIILAGGLRESASTTDIEIARRISDAEVGTFSSLVPVQVNPDLSFRQDPVTLEPFDNIIVRRKPNFTLEKLIRIEGQVNSPGIFAVQSAQEKVSDVIRRAGGLTSLAYPKGATLIRRTEFYETESEQIRRRRNLADLQMKLIQDPNNSEAQELLMERLFLDMEKISEDDNYTSLESESKREALTGILDTRPNLEPIKIQQTEAVAIDLEAILKNPGSTHDLILEEGDIISIPRQLQTVRLRGDVIYPTTVRHETARSMNYYINRAGGFDIRANKKRTYVVYANGEVARTKSFLGLRSYPSIAPGSEVIVPTKGPRINLRPGELVGITTGLATLALIISQINWGK